LATILNCRRLPAGFVSTKLQGTPIAKARCRHDHPRSAAPDGLAPKITVDEDQDRLDRALEELMKEDHWMNEFIERLNAHADAAA
jgi:hypothetical protein